MAFSHNCLTLSALVSLVAVACPSGGMHAAEPPDEAKPVVLTTADLEELSLHARREVQELIARKREHPQREDLNIKVGRQGAIFEGDITPGRAEIRILGRSIRVGDRRNQPRPRPIAVFDENAPLEAPRVAEPNFPDDLTVTIWKSGREPMTINIIKGDVDVTISGEQLDQIVEQFRPYVVQMLESGLSGVKSPPAPGGDVPAPGVDLGDPASELGEPKDSLDDEVPALPTTP
jgi:hypothetical protein